MTTGKRLAVFAHWDERDEIKPYVHFHLERLRPIAGRLIFVSTSQLADVELAKVRPLVDEIILRENVGFDFAMWQHALLREDLGRYDELVLTNSSVLGPISPLEDAFDAMKKVECDYWGMTESDEIARHVQSYFLAFRSRVLHADAFRRFWAAVAPYEDKKKVIRSYEVGLSKVLGDEGFRGSALVPLTAPRPRWRRLLGPSWNPTLADPLRLIDLGMPFLKLELFRDNPARVELDAVRRAAVARGYPAPLLQVAPRRRA